MTHEVDQARAIQESIRRILIGVWDPIGVGAVPEARDEYERYVAGVYRLLLSGASAADVARHLTRVEVEEMGLEHRDVIEVMAAALELVKLDVRVGAGGARSERSS